jgi:hypothetical protein
MKKEKTIDQLDLFAAPMPTFNIEGLEKISTTVGFFFSILLFLIMGGYSASRVAFFVKGDRPDIQTFTIHNGFNLTELVDLKDFGFQLAFNIEIFKNDFSTLRLEDDPNLVEWRANFQEKDEKGNIAHA